MTESIRIQKYLSQKGICSRRQAETYVREGRLEVDGKKLTLGDRVIPGSLVMLDGKPLDIPDEVEPVLLAFYKPRGVESTLKAIDKSKTLADFDFGGRVFPVGRLDKDSHGLLLLTNDGELANKLMHPRYEKEKEYLVQLHKKIEAADIQALEGGIMLDDKKTAPCKITLINELTMAITLKEGRNRQIRRMCVALGYEVTDLLRIRVGKVHLKDLKPGDVRPLNFKIMQD
jgi:23S rRNA pseudouridine2604 synthase